MRASSGSERLRLGESLRSMLGMPGVGLLVVAAPIVGVAAILAAVDAAGLGDTLSWLVWLAAIGTGFIALAMAILGARPGIERSTRIWLTGTYACWSGWLLAFAAARPDADRIEPQPEDILLLLGMVCAARVVATLLGNVRDPIIRPWPLFLDAGCVVLAVCTMLVAIYGSEPRAVASGLYLAAYPAAFFVTAGVALLAVVAERLPLSLRGGHVLLPGILLFGIGCASWVDGWLSDAGPDVVPHPLFALAVLLCAAGIATCGYELAERQGTARWAGPVQDALPLAVVALAAAILLTTSERVADVNLLRAVTALTVAFAVAREVVLLRSRILVLGELDRAGAEIRAALERANAAEAEQRRRADLLAGILKASEDLALVGEGDVSYESILAAITPSGATAFLGRLWDGEYVVLAAHGPLAGHVAMIHSSADSGGWMSTIPAVSYYSASGWTMPGHRVGPPPIELPRTPQATLAIRLADRAGRTVAALHLIDPDGERILEPHVVALAHLVANQIAVALENQALVARVQAQLEETQRVQAQLIHATKLGAIGELAAAVAHEVNNPLTGILGFAELLLNELPANDLRHEEVAIIRTEAVRARSIMRALVDFARPRPPQRVPTDVNAIARETMDLIRYRTGDAGIEVVEAYADLPTVDVDPAALKQVLLNLLNNALRAMPEGGTLRVATARHRDGLSIAVTDSGVGMDADTRAKIFSPFFTTSGPGAGAGLGLPVSQQIVEGHGGRIDVESAPGHGSTFTVWLPIGLEDAEHGSGGAGRERKSQPEQGGTDDAGDGARADHHDAFARATGRGVAA